MNINATAIRDRLANEFGQDVMRDRHVLAYLKASQSIEKIATGNLLYEDVATELQKFLEELGKGSSQGPKVTMLEERQRIVKRADALSQLYAIDAAQVDEVIRFRNTALNGKLIEKTKVRDWIEKHRDPQRSFYVEMAVNEHPAFDRKTGTFIVKKFGPITRSSTRSLEFGEMGNDHVQRVGTKAGSVLDNLRRLSEALSKKYAWQPAQASVFVLTGMVPYAAPISFSFNIATSRFTIDFDIFTTPRQLADAYRTLKKDCLKSTRTKQLSEKHMRLAVFADAEDWKAAMKKWNGSNKKERYTNPAIFKRDAIKAKERLLNPIVPKKLD